MPCIPLEDTKTLRLRQALHFPNVMRLPPSGAGMRNQISATLASKIFDSPVVLLYPEGRLGNGCGNIAVTWQEWGCLHLSSKSMDPTPAKVSLHVSFSLAWLLPHSAQTHWETLPFQDKKKYSQTGIYFLLRGEGKNKRKNNKLRKKKDLFGLQ